MTTIHNQHLGPKHLQSETGLLRADSVAEHLELLRDAESVTCDVAFWQPHHVLNEKGRESGSAVTVLDRGRGCGPGESFPSSDCLLVLSPVDVMRSASMCRLLP